MIGGNYHLFTDDNKETTLHGLGFSTLDKSKKSIKKIERYYDSMKNNQKLNKYSPKNVRPRVYFLSKEEIEKYYAIQKMYRILGLVNRAKTIFQRYPSIELEKSIKLFQTWMIRYHKNMIKYKNTKIKRSKNSR
ncbi:MAG: hypothetical protein WD512_00540 [Candidatus Paceibacterota bacterium]